MKNKLIPGTRCLALLASLVSVGFSVNTSAQSIFDRINNGLNQLNDTLNQVGDVADEVDASAREIQQLRDEASNVGNSNNGSSYSNGFSANNLDDRNVAQMAANECIQSTDSNEAVGFMSGVFNRNRDAFVSGEGMSKYLVGLCIPDNFNAQFALTDYLISKGAMYNFYMERSLEDLAIYLDEAGIELGIKVEALQRDSAISDALRQQDTIENADKLFSSDQIFSENVELFLPAIAKLREEQKGEALLLAGKARGHATNSTFFLSRGVYVSGRISDSLTEDARNDLDRIVNARGSAVDRATTFLRTFNRRNESNTNSGMAKFYQFTTSNIGAVIRTMNNGFGIIRTFNNSATDIPELSSDEISDDVERLNDEWELPAEFADEEAFGSDNVFYLEDV